MPDIWRKWRLSTIAYRLNAPLPINFRPYASDTIQSWHFINNAYPNTIHCALNKTDNVIWAVDQSELGMQETQNQHTKALLMVFQEHFIGDAHQPLHVYNRVNSQCQNDRGGNDYCLKYNRKGKCSKNLHALWDSGVGYLKPKTNIQRVAYRLQLIYPKSLFTQQLTEKNPSQWVKEEYQYVAFIYSTPEDSKLSSFYYYRGQLIAQRQLALAGYRLAEILNQELS